MWQVDNDRHCPWRLEHEFGLKRIDRLLDSVTVSDRPERIRLALPNFAQFGGWLRRLCSRHLWPLSSRPIVRRAGE